ncbi:MAG: hypothetical protein J6Y65_03890, partial [Eggerthellaceae bacterium]|nr:hypothetical protein [Eggerthellaceae bacterium]
RAMGEEILAIAPCRSVHTLFMKKPIDIAFVDKRAMVLKSYSNVTPGKFLKARKAVLVLERFHTAGPWLVAGTTLSELMHDEALCKYLSKGESSNEDMSGVQQ